VASKISRSKNAAIEVAIDEHAEGARIEVRAIRGTNFTAYVSGPPFSRRTMIEHVLEVVRRFLDEESRHGE
jgi:hypothetical protein